LLDALAVRATVDLHLLGCALSLAGVLACLDGYMNIAMEQTEEYVNGQLKAKYGDTFIRGNNGMPRKRALSTPHMHLLCVRRAAAQSCT
jgi:U6 snRNA-associated Sm-like protein LSm6